MEQAIQEQELTQELAQEQQELAALVEQWAKREAGGSAAMHLPAVQAHLVTILLKLTSVTVGTNLRTAHVATVLAGSRSMLVNEVPASAADWQQEAARLLWPTAWNIGTKDGLQVGRILVGIVQQADAEVQLADLEQLLDLVARQSGVEDAAIALGWGYSAEPGTGIRLLLLAGMSE
ncbi:hypothetical protein [Hymenobacter rigui]|uniref:Uncharacterized protein n=1 Tax=Hymenobacter rigui TaxID=334424 RepID=A0A428KS79_9BACT|nr:hypothetical protein [Hymenobacter rigui]RSK49388.1 hypothetical protein EI291_07810 [Hymenobacter rigui]